MSNLNSKTMKYQTIERNAIAIYLIKHLANLGKMQRSPDQRQESGFSLIESLVAVAVVSILIVAITPMIALSTSARINARRIDQATQAARSYVDAVRGGVINTLNYPTALIKNPPNAQGQYTFEDVAPPTTSTALTGSSTCQNVTNTALGGTSVLGSCVDTNGNGFSVDDPQDLFIQPMRSGSSNADELKSQGFWLAVRIYRASALSGSATLFKGTESNCNSGGTAFSATSSVICPLVTIRSQILPTVNSSLTNIQKGIGSN